MTTNKKRYETKQPSHINFGTYLQHVRRTRFSPICTQAALARNIGVCPETIGRIERGEHVPSMNELIRISQCIGENLIVLQAIAYPEYADHIFKSVKEYSEENFNIDICIPVNKRLFHSLNKTDRRRVDQSIKLFTEIMEKYDEDNNVQNGRKYNN